MYQANIKVTLKKTVADPQGLTIKHALDSLGYKDIDSVRAGKFFIINLKSSDKAKAEQETKEMCEKLLVNPVIEEYSFEIKEIK
ncbi:phosphoribosylformylglycinamidine synthase subunit PurS [Candidatus Saganbacteria bacterium]|nr:phosphoribosylformylglycinamidine synthase subunit PurS [Candidatus Saganbacteria bacterium]